MEHRGAAAPWPHHGRHSDHGQPEVLGFLSNEPDSTIRNRIISPRNMKKCTSSAAKRTSARLRRERSVERSVETQKAAQRINFFVSCNFFPDRAIHRSDHY